MDPIAQTLAIFIEDGEACYARVVEATENPEWFSATFETAQPSLSCELNRVRSVGDGPVKSWSDQSSFGDRWSVKVSRGEFYPDTDYWEASFRWGGGFRVFFQPEYVARFLRRDVSWLTEFYEGDDEGDEAKDE